MDRPAPANGGSPGAVAMVVLGRVLGPYGVAGWIKVAPYTEAPDALLGYAEWWLQATGQEQWRRLACTAGRRHGETLVAHLAGIDERDGALALKGCDIGVPRSSLPAAGEAEIYWADLVGLTVVNRAGQVLGTVRGVTEHGAHPLLQVMADDGVQRLIPYVPALVDAVDMAAGRIDVDWGEDY